MEVKKGTVDVTAEEVSLSPTPKQDKPPAGANQQQHNKNNQNQSKSTRPYREIYRPPSVRSKGSRPNNCGNSQQGKCNNAPNKGHLLGSNNGGYNLQHSPHMGRRQFHYNNSVGSQQDRNAAALNANANNAKEFQLTMNQQQIQNQQLVNLLQLGQLDPKFYGDVLASATYSLQQSKSLGSNLNTLWQQQQQQHNNKQPPFLTQQFGVGPVAYLQQQSSQTILAANFGKLVQAGQDDQSCKFNRLCQSKSSGSIPNQDTFTKPRVHFDMKSNENEEMDAQATINMIKNAESRFANLNFNGLNPIMPPKQQQLQKSRTGFLLNLQAPTQKNVRNGNQGILKQEANPGVIKRSKSFGAGTTSQRSANVPFMSVSGHSVYSDFQISKWPKRVQETVTTSVTAVERVAARQQIEMVNLIFDAMLTPNWSFENEFKGDGQFRDVNSGDEDTQDLSTPAVHIFLYFIQREKDRTVMESLLNTCFATYQKLFGSGHSLTFDLAVSQAGTFLRFLSTLYSQVRLLRRQKPGGRRGMDEMGFSVLAVLCDSCLAMLRSHLSSDPESMGCLFTVMTSQGRDMETTFPLKMKQLLAAVRDALLGLGPYSQGPLCTSVQKTLMQLIELHAANWALPASAVRYYYSNNNNNGSAHSKNNVVSVGTSA